MSEQIAPEYADLELADLESAVSRIQLTGQGAVTRKPTVTVSRDVAELAPTANASISAQLSRAATRPLAHTVRRLVQCELDVYAHLLDHASSAVRRDAGAALTDAKSLLLSVRSLLSAPRDAAAQDAVKSAASRVSAWLSHVHDEQLLGHESDVTGTQSVLLSPRGDAGHAREQTAFLERERAKNQLLLQQQQRSGGASIVAAVVDDAGASSVSAQQEEARLQRALQRKTAGAARDPKRKTWGANALANAYDTANGGSTNSSNSTTPTATPTHPRTPPVAAQEHHASPHASTVVRVVPASPLAAPVAAGGKSSTTDAEEARLQRSLNRSSYRGTWSPAKAAATTTASAPSTPSHSIQQATAGVSSPTTRVEDISRTVAQVARVVSPRTSYTAQPNQTPPPRTSATRGDADRFNASLDSLTRALGAASPHASSPSASELQRQADRRASFEREKVAAEEAQAKVAADLARDEQAYERARKHAQDLRERAEQEAKAKVAAREKADAEERAARQARRDADVAADRERARAKLEERSAAVAAEKERTAAQRAAEESRREEARREEARRDEARAEAARRESEQRTQQLQQRQQPSAAKSVLHSVQKQESQGRARAGTVEKVLKSTVKELTADDDDDDNNSNSITTTTTTTSSIVRIDSDRAKWDGIGDAMSGLVSELDELAVVTSAAGTPIVSTSKTTATTTKTAAAPASSSLSTQSAHEQLEAERAALARERARLDEERRLLDEERERSRQTFDSELERERKALERERQELARLKAQHHDSALDVLISDLRSFPISSTPAQREESVRSHKVRVTLNELEREFVQELHALRRAPRSYAALLRDSRVPFFVGRQLNLTRSNGQRVALASAEGVAPVLEAIEILERTKPLDDVRVYDGLTFAVRDAVARNSTQPDALERILEYGRAEGKMRQNAWIGTLPALTASDIVMAMLISDGDPQRRQRIALLAPETTSVGVCAGHATHFATDGNYMVLVLCEHFDE